MIEASMVPPDDVPEHKECRWCGLLFCPDRQGQELCSYECSLSEAGRD